NLEKVVENARARVAEGRELSIQSKRAELNLARAQQRVESLESDLETVERNLAVVLGFSSEDRIRATTDEPQGLRDVPESPETATDQAIEGNKEIRILESRIQAKNLEIKGYKAARLPQVGLVAQYNMLAKYNFQDFFAGRFQRNNGQLGASFTIPLLVG